jgi:hypothetical protein
MNIALLKWNLQLKYGQGKEGYWTYATWASSLRTVLTAFKPCSRNLTVYGYLITALVMIEGGRMG